MLAARRSSRLLLILGCAVVTLSTPALAHRSVGTRASSGYGQFNQQSFWELTPVSQDPTYANVRTETVCSGGVITIGTAQVCPSTYTFLYQISTGPNDLVLTFSGLTNFPFNTGGFSGFGILTCDQDPTTSMLCSQNLPTSTVNSIGWDAIDGDLVVTVPSVPSGDTLTFYITENTDQNNPGSPLPPPVLTLGGAVIVPVGLSFGSVQAGAVGSSQTLTIANSGDFSSTLDISKISIPNDFVSSGICTALTPGEYCALPIAFNPSSPGSVSGSVSISDDSPTGAESVRLTGTANSAGISVVPADLMFGPQAVGTNSQAISINIANAASNSQGLSISSIASSLNPISGQQDFSSTNSCGAAIAPGSGCTVQVTFAPTESGDTRTSMTISDNSPEGSHTIQLRGNGLSPSTATVNAESLTFSAQTDGTTSQAQTITVTSLTTAPDPNGGGKGLNVTALDATAAFAISSETCTTAGLLSANATCTVAVVFQPSLAGQYTGSLTIATDAPGGTLVVPLSGTGLEAATATPSFSVPAGMYTSEQSVTITDATAGATIYYTTDGTTPTTNSTMYTGAITVASSATLQAIAIAPGYTASAVATEQYTLNLTPSGFSINGAAVTVSAGATTGDTSTITITPAGGFTGSVNMTATISSSPTGAVNLPTLSFGSAAVVNITGANAATTTLTVSTTSATSAAHSSHRIGGSRWVFGGGTFLALIVFLDGRMRRQQRRSHFWIYLMLLAFLGGSVACGGSSTSSGPTTNGGGQGTTPGSYTITIVGTSGPITAKGSVSLTVN
jgi:hypothetical protein